MRAIKQFLIIALVVLMAGNIVTAVYEGSSDKTEPPVIRCQEGILQVSANASETDLLQGVTASDAQDGDLTRQIVISGISKLISNNTAKVTYLVFDSDNNMAMYVRRIEYTDYEKPRFTLDRTKPLVFSSVDEITLVDRVGATDVVDGDITSRVRVSTLASTDDSRIYDVSVQVTNSLGDTAWLKLPVLELPADANRPTIRLNEYLIYIEQGEAFEPLAYVDQAISAQGQVLSMGHIQVEHQVNTGIAGDYRVIYTCTDSGSEGIAVLTVVVK